ncbi:MAG: hypothetical protein AAGF11_00340 [Myxococcota bacterium]
MDTIARTKQRIERLERRRDGLVKRLDGIERFDEIRHEGMKVAVELAQKRYGRALSDAELIEAVKEELDRRVNPPGVWEAISDFGIRLFVDIAVLHVRNRAKFLQRRLDQLNARLERQRAKLRRLLDADDIPVSFSLPVASGEAEVPPRPRVFADTTMHANGGTTQQSMLPLLLIRVERLEQAVAQLYAGDDLDDLDDLDDEP